MKILVIDFALRFGDVIGGQERMVLSLVKQLNAQGHEPIFLLREESGLSKRLKELNLIYFIKDINKYLIKFQLNSIKKLIKKEDISKVICLDSFANRLGYLLVGSIKTLQLFAFRFDVYESQFMSLSLKRRKRFYKKLDKKAFSQFTKIFCISNEIIKEVINLNVPKKKIIRFKPGIEPELNLGEFIIRSDGIIGLLSLGRFDEQKKSFITLIKACQILKDRGINNFRLTIAGDGPDRELIQESGTDLAEAGLFKLYPYHVNPAELYKKNDIFILTSRYEGFPFVIPEALSNYCAIISTKIPELLENFKENTEILYFNFHDAESLADNLKKLIEDKKLRETLQKRGKIISEEFKMDHVVSELIKEIL